jgi:hypothetical protein
MPVSPSRVYCPSGTTQQIKSSVYFLVVGVAVFFLSWSTVLCRVARGVSKYPDKMPTYVWVATFGMLMLYCTFLFAQCSLVATRVRFILAEQSGFVHPELQPKESVLARYYKDSKHLPGGFVDRAYLLFLHAFSMPNWQTLAFLAFCMSLDLVAAVLFGLSSIRREFGIPEDQQRAEPWATMVFLLMIWVTVLGVSMLNELCETDSVVAENPLGHSTDQAGNVKVIITLRDSKTDQDKPPLPSAPPLEGETTDSSNENDHLISDQGGEAQPKGCSLMGWACRIIVYMGAATGIFVLWGTMVMSNLEGVSETPWKVACIALSVVIVTLLLAMGRRRIYATKESVAADKGKDHVKQLENFRLQHGAAMCFHIALALFTAFIGLAVEDRSWLSDYIQMNQSSYVFTTDWGRFVAFQDDDALRAAELLANGKITIGYCATDNPLPIYTVIIACSWSVLSAAHHYMSARRIYQALQKQKTAEPGHSSGWKEKVAYVLFAVAFLVLVMRCDDKRTALVVVSALLIPSVLFVHVSCWGVWDLFPVEQNTETKTFTDIVHTAIDDVSAYKWIEYTTSATLMHVVICHLGGVHSAHELVLCAACLAISMLFVNMSDAALRPAETKITIHTRIQSETAFTFLSFFAKGVLALSLSLPWVFDQDRGDYKMEPSQFCT